MNRITMYDPPLGWRYGFPKEYKPLLNETVAQTLLRDGYPQKEVDWGGAEHVRFWETEDRTDTEFCRHCGAGVGKFRRDGEGTCPKCDSLKPSASGVAEFLTREPLPAFDMGSDYDTDGNPNPFKKGEK